MKPSRQKKTGVKKKKKGKGPAKKKKDNEAENEIGGLHFTSGGFWP